MVIMFSASLSKMLCQNPSTPTFLLSEFVMSVPIDVEAAGVAVLRTPPYDASLFSPCLQFDTKLFMRRQSWEIDYPQYDFGTFEIQAVSDSQTTTIFQGIMNIPNEWQPHAHSLPLGEHAIVFKFETLISSSVLTELDTDILFWLANVSVTDMPCTTGTCCYAPEVFIPHLFLSSW